ncbi:hypothetical protein PROFUN_11330 [Planoprotostelium fungivorum]|uniref:Uncharacterized protein n=1 Tax=Planoprotostelium fungivorum TaxID=1890364 RepID=A0A2P6NAC6_9EUKA|nr:hypothetical protein PROFUN_11330 [Planoprotostelium fungivorum]
MPSSIYTPGFSNISQRLNEHNGYIQVPPQILSKLSSNSSDNHSNIPVIQNQEVSQTRGLYRPKTHKRGNSRDLDTTHHAPGMHIRAHEHVQTNSEGYPLIWSRLTFGPGEDFCSNFFNQWSGSSATQRLLF